MITVATGPGVRNAHTWQIRKLKYVHVFVHELTRCEARNVEPGSFAKLSFNYLYYIYVYVYVHRCIWMCVCRKKQRTESLGP